MFLEKILSILPRTTSDPPLSVVRILRTLGENIRLARRRRKFTLAIVAERAGISAPTLRAVERGEASSTMAAYANVLHCLGLERDLLLVAKDDVLGRKLQDLGLDPAPSSRQRQRR